ncbi:MAG: hypothetical protein ACRD96_01675, partial [Bryobacteraceae bacterium]
FPISRGVRLVLGTFLLLVVAFLLWLPFPFSRNLVLHTCLFAVFDISGSIAFLYRDLGGPTVAMSSNLLFILVGLGCQILWLIYLVPAGETRPAALFPGRKSRADKLLAQLDALNSTLLRSSGK